MSRKRRRKKKQKNIGAKPVRQKELPGIERFVEGRWRKEKGVKGLPEPIKKTRLASIGVKNTEIDATVHIPDRFMVALVRWQAKHKHDEVQGHGWIEDGEIKWMCRTGIGQPGGVESTDAQVAMALEMAIKDGMPGLNLQWHTHPNIGVFWSRTDTRDHGDSLKLSQDVARATGTKSEAWFMVISGIKVLTRFYKVDEVGEITYNDGVATISTDKTELQGRRKVTTVQSRRNYGNYGSYGSYGSYNYGSYNYGSYNIKGWPTAQNLIEYFDSNLDVFTTAAYQAGRSVVTQLETLGRCDVAAKVKKLASWAGPTDKQPEESQEGKEESDGDDEKWYTEFIKATATQIIETYDKSPASSNVAFELLCIRAETEYGLVAVGDIVDYMIEEGRESVAEALSSIVTEDDSYPYPPAKEDTEIQSYAITQATLDARRFIDHYDTLAPAAFAVIVSATLSEDSARTKNTLTAIRETGREDVVNALEKIVRKEKS